MKPPAIPILDSSNLAMTWKSWKEEFTLYTELTIPEADENTRVKLFYYLIGEGGRELLDTLDDSTSARRTYLPESTKGDTETELETVNMVNYLPISAERLSFIRSATKEDTKLKRVTEMILTGWPQNKNDIPTDTQHYHSFQDELSFQDGIVFRGERAVIPDALGADITRSIHSSHL